MLGKLTGPGLPRILKKQATLKDGVQNQIPFLCTSLSCLLFWEDNYFLQAIQSKIHSNFASI